MEISNTRNPNNSRLYFLTYFTVEPTLFFYLISVMLSYSATQHFSIFKACHVDLNNNKSLCTQVANRDLNENDTSALIILKKSQIINTHTIGWSSPIQYGIPAISILFLGAWSDRSRNRKALIILPIFGEFMATFGKIMATYYLSEWPLWVVAVVDTVPGALTGGTTVLKMAINSYIVDITSTDNRIFRLGLLGVISGISIPVGLSVSGILTKNLGYYGIYSLILTTYALAIIYTMMRIQDKVHRGTDDNLMEKIVKFIHPRNIWDTISVLFRYKERQLLQIILIILAHVIRTGPIYGEGSHLYFYAAYKFKMNLVEYTLYKTYSVSVALIGVAVSIFVFTKILKINDALLGILGTISDVSSALMLGLATSKTLFYIGPLLNFFGELAGLAIKSLGAKFVNQDDIGKFYSLLGLFDGVGPTIYVSLYSKLYAATLDTFSGAFYVVGAVMTFPDIFIFLYLYILHKKLQKDVVEKPQEKDKYAYENAVTSL